MTLGVPQSSVLGRVIFTMYTAHPGDLIESHNLQGHNYADDSQLYKSCALNAIPEAIKLLEQCLVNGLNLLLSNNLSLNALKTEFMSRTTQRLTKVNYDVTLNISDTVVTYHELLVTLASG